MSLPDLLWSLCQREATGLLRVERVGIAKTLYFENGRIVFASSSDPDDRLGELFLRQGLIELDELETALGALHTGKRLGTLLVEAGALDPEQLVRGVLTQVEGIVLDLFAWEEGSYRFDEGDLPGEEVIKLGMQTGELLLRGIRGIRSFRRIRRSVGGAQTRYGLTPDWRDRLAHIEPAPGEEQLIDRLQRGDCTLDELCRDVYSSNFEIYQAIWALKVLGAVAIREEAFADRAEEGDRGNLNRTDFAELLVRLGRSGATGVLYVSRAGHERSFHVRGGRCVFATSNDIDDGLLAFLLRRGVISLGDRDETAKRLLSNKRVGTILRELGVIDERDLREMVREQLCEIVYDTFRWQDAEYAFVQGELPSVEEITLEQDLDRLVAEGLRRVDSWSRVWRGCGGLEVRLELLPSYLSVLDAMNAGPEEWQVIAALREPRSAREICRAAELSDYRVCQIVWGLRVLGAVRPVSTVEAEDAVQAAEAVTGTSVPAVDLDAEEDVVPEPEPETPPAAPYEPEVEEIPVRMVVDTTPEPVSIPTFDEPSPEATQLIPRELRDRALEEPAEAAAEIEPEPEPEPEPEAEPVEAEGWQLENANRTLRLDRDEIEAWSDWMPPEDLDRTIARFNAVQRVVYRAVRAEVGAGAANFIRACCLRLDGASSGLMEGVSLLPDGTWDSEELRRSVCDRQADDPWSDYRSLIGIELESLRQHIGEARLQDLQQQIDKVEQGATLST